MIARLLGRGAGGHWAGAPDPPPPFPVGTPPSPTPRPNCPPRATTTACNGGHGVCGQHPYGRRHNTATAAVVRPAPTFHPVPFNPHPIELPVLAGYAFVVVVVGRFTTTPLPFPAPHRPHPACLRYPIYNHFMPSPTIPWPCPGDYPRPCLPALPPVPYLYHATVCSASLVVDAVGTSSRWTRYRTRT